MGAFVKTAKSLGQPAANGGGWHWLVTAAVVVCLVLLCTFWPFQSGMQLCAGRCSLTFPDKVLTNAMHGMRPTTSNGTTRKNCAVGLPPEAFFAVKCFDFTDTSGGITVLHFLVDRLNRLYGRLEPVAFLYGCKGTNPAWATPLLPPWRNVSKGIAVYPEVTWGNDMNSGHVIRWVLWFPGGNGGPPASAYNPKDLIACYSPGICTQFSPAFTVRQLRLIEYGFDHLHDLPVVANRTGTIIYHGKTRWRRQGAGQPFHRNYSRFKPINGTVLPAGMSKRERMKLFATAETFYSYDAGTWRNVEAALAGAKSVVLPVEGVSKEEWVTSIYGAEELKYGVAYGEDDLSHAVATQHLLLPTLKRRALDQERELQQFVAEACLFFNMSCTLEPC